MRIAFVYDLLFPSSTGGVEKRVSDMAVALAGRGHDVHVFGTQQWEGPSSITRDGVTIHGIPGGGRPIYSKSGRRSVRQSVTYVNGLRQELDTREFDVVDVQNMAPLTALYALWSCRRSATTAILTWHEVWGRYWFRYLGPLGLLGWAAEKLMTRWGGAHVAVSRRTLARLRDEGVEGAVLVENGIDLEAVDRIEPSVERFDVLFVGRLAPHKGVRSLLQAVEIVATKGRTVNVGIVGDGPEAGILRKSVESYPNVEMLGSLAAHEEVLSHIKSARMLVLPSSREGFGLVALEAMACAVPVVTVDAPANAAQDLVTEGENGLVVADSPQTISEAIIRLMDDSAARDRLSRGARDTAVRFDSHDRVEALEVLYRKSGSRHTDVVTRAR